MTEAVDLSGDGGVLKTILKEGTAGKKPSPGDTVYVHYTGTLVTGEKFDSSKDRNEPFHFSLAKSQVIKAWDIGIATMNIGEVAVFECRSDYAYGDSGSPPKIPGKATLKFEVELIKFEGEDISPDRDGTIIKSVIAEGERYNYPSEFAPVTIHAVGNYQGTVFYDKTVTYELGEASEVGLPEGVDRALRRIAKGEKCRIVLKGNRFTYGSKSPEGFEFPINAELEFTIFLTDFEKVKASWEMTDEEKVEHSRVLKDKGTKFLKLDKLHLALNKYEAIVTILEHVNPTEDKLKEDLEAVLIAACLNCALVNVKQNLTAEAIKYCDKVLAKNPDHVKALYRKAQALQQRTELEEAMKIYNRVIELEPENKAAAQQILVCKKLVNEIIQKEKKKYSGLFDKLSKMEEAEKSNRIDDADAGEGTSDQPQQVEVEAN
ncbi:unnamed protein product [Bursaphelenchus okinawaensis]|uniref:peptidylprolyl isomerase n=1 Tax=Bursaphelenchus okinawaensis TaxID=465554 RepID=A0A811L835_9BILA|nr:unnamed protein product [Bursaphelenchus okinawaensis]CAG9118827.1 unnamed protein product [Bursaphelenchus okinawaensis]